MKERITFDIDDVLADTLGALHAYVNQEAGVALTKEHWSIAADYGVFYKTVLDNAGIDVNEYLPKFHATMIEDQTAFLPVPGAVETITRHQDNFDIMGLSSRWPEMEGATRIWVESFFGTAFQELVLLDYGDKAVQTKGDVCLKLGATLHFDDYHGHCDTVLAAGAEAVLVGEHGWHHQIGDGQYTHCKNMFEVGAFLDERLARR